MIISSLLNPYEEEINYLLYQKGVKEIKLEEFEKFFINNININSFLLSLKLANNQNRIKRLLMLDSIDNNFFLKIFNLYSFRDEDIFEGDNRDVIIAFIKRFFPLKNDYNHNQILFTPSNLAQIAILSNNKQALEAMLKFSNIEFRQKNRLSPINIYEALAINPNITPKIKQYLFNLDNKRVFIFLAFNPSLSAKEQKFLLKKEIKEVNKNLATNINLDFDVFKELLKKSELKEILLANQLITKTHLEKIDKKDYLLLAKNPNLKAIKSLLNISKELDFALASNINLDKEDIKALYNKYKDEISLELSKNPNTPKELLEQFYKLNNYEIDLNLASNPNTPLYIIKELFSKNDILLNKALAKNSNLDDEIIEFFKLDSELLRIMSQNENILKKIKSKKEYI